MSFKSLKSIFQIAAKSISTRKSFAKDTKMFLKLKTLKKYLFTKFKKKTPNQGAEVFLTHCTTSLNRPRRWLAQHRQTPKIIMPLLTSFVVSRTNVWEIRVPRGRGNFRTWSWVRLEMIQIIYCLLFNSILLRKIDSSTRPSFCDKKQQQNNSLLPVELLTFCCLFCLGSMTFYFHLFLRNISSSSAASCHLGI